ncbi:hypothetical protein [Sphingomonas sp.]|uniref:hypothetical protein n=1 Tax=Sphingomonas sp. TaxID=28214 RepID=UPI003CC60206
MGRRTSDAESPAIVAAAAAASLGGAPATFPVEPLAAIEPAVDAAAARAAAERVADTTAPATAPAADPALVIADPLARVAVFPDPALPAPPEAPQPVVTAAPPLAAEPSAVDVIKAAQADDDRTGASLGFDPVGATAGRDGPRFGEAGQPVLAIEPATPTAATVAAAAAATPLPEPLVPLIGDELVTIVEVVGPPRGRYRAGLAFGAEPRRFLLTQLTDGQLARLQSDPQLAVGIRTIGADELTGLEG